MPKFEKFLWRIWKIKSSDSSLNLCPLNKLGQVTMIEATKMNQKPILIDRVLKNVTAVKSPTRCQKFTIFTGKHLCWSGFLKNIFLESFFFNFIKMRHWCRCFPVNIVKFLRTPFLTEHLQWLLLLSILQK